MTGSCRIGFSLVSVLALSSYLAGCKSEPEPTSSKFAARCYAAVHIFYVDGGKGPEFIRKRSREDFWLTKYRDLTGRDGAAYDSASAKLLRLESDMRWETRTMGHATTNAAMRKIMDACEPHEQSNAKA